MFVAMVRRVNLVVGRLPNEPRIAVVGPLPKFARWVVAFQPAIERAKIVLFDDGPAPQAPIAVPSRGSSLLAKTVSTN